MYGFPRPGQDDLHILSPWIRKISNFFVWKSYLTRFRPFYSTKPWVEGTLRWFIQPKRNPSGLSLRLSETLPVTWWSYPLVASVRVHGSTGEALLKGALTTHTGGGEGTNHPIFTTVGPRRPTLCHHADSPNKPQIFSLLFTALCRLASSFEKIVLNYVVV